MAKCSNKINLGSGYMSVGSSFLCIPNTFHIVHDLKYKLK